MFGAGTPFASHVKEIRIPIQDLDLKALALSTVAVSADYNNSLINSCKRGF